MKNRAVITLAVVAAVVINVLVFADPFQWMGGQKEEKAGAALQYGTGVKVIPHSEQFTKLMAELKEESVEVTLQKLNADAMQFGLMGTMFHNDVDNIFPEAERIKIYARDINAVLANIRVLKAYEDLQKVDKKTAAALLSKHIRENLVSLRQTFQFPIGMIERGEHKGDTIAGSLIGRYDPNVLGHVPLDHPPTKIGRRYAILSYILIASLLELEEVRPAVEEVIAFAREEYELFCSLDVKEAPAFMSVLLTESLYNPSLLLTAARCDPTWNPEKRKLLDENNLVNCNVASWRTALPEHNVKNMLTIRYYVGITDAEFNEFFGK